MIIFKLCFFIAYFVFCEANSFYSELSSDLQRINTPEGLGNFLQEQLAKNESRSLSEPCSRHIKEYAKGLLTLRLWAIRMFDATAKFPSGFLRGNAAALGTFDECIGIQKTSEKFGTINGKYCLGVLELIKVTPSKKNVLDFSDEEVEQPVIEPEPRLVNLVRATVGFPWGICLPDSCSAKDFRMMSLFFLRFSEEDCQTQASQYTKFDYGDIGALIFFGIIAGLIAGSTLYEIFMDYKRKGQGSALFKSFSILTNSSKIFRNDGNRETSCVHGIKCINFLIITLGYRYVLHVFLPLDNWVTLVKWVFDLVQALELVEILDTYFVVSAMLISYNYLKYREKGIKFNIIYYYLNRIIRFTVPFAAIILFNATLLRHIGSGPVWLRSRNYMFVKNCRDNWWTSLLYIQNYAHPYFTDMCVMQAFHLSVEMQLFILSPIFLIPLLQHPMFVISALLFLLFCAMVACFLHVWVFNIRSLILSFRSLQHIIDYIRYVFLATHSRASAWIIGFILGYIIFKSKDTKIPVKKVHLVLAVLFLWIASMAIIVMCPMVADEFKSNTFKYEYNWLTHAFHRTLIHPLWALAIAWIIFACAKGYGGPVNSFLSAYIFQVISRISYSTFLTNLTLISLLTFQTRVGVDFSDLATIHKACADLLLCLALGFVWTISFESPFVNITKVMFKKFEKKETPKV